MQIVRSSGPASASFGIKPVRFVLGIIACVGVALTLFSLLFGFRSIPTNSVGVKLRFGALSGIEDPGLTYVIPYVDELVIVPTQRLLKLEFGFGTSGASNPYQQDRYAEDTETMITGDLNTALVPWVVQYRITDPKMYLFGVREPEQTLRDLSESVMREVIGDRTVDEVLTIGRDDIETASLKRLAELCSDYKLGLQIQQVQLATVRPPAVVQAAFNEVNQAQQEKQTAINQAWAVYNDAVPNASGQAKERLKQAEAYAFHRVNQAKGDAEKFTLLLAEYRKAPDVTRRRIYLEQMQALLPALQKKIIVDDSLKNILQTLPLTTPESTPAPRQELPRMPPTFIRILQSRTMAILGLIFILTGLKWGSMLFIVRQYEDAIVTRFGKAIRTVTTPGLKLKLPFFDKVNRFDKRVLAWDGPSTECPTKDKLYLIVDCFARWRISDPLLYYNRLNDERSALSRLDDILGSETRTAVATHDLVEVIRVTKERQPLRDPELEKSGTVLPSKLPDIQLGRGEIEKQITERTRQKIADFGIELLDERFKRSKYNPAVAEKIIERMSSERHQIAARFRSEGHGEAANISGQKESEVASIISSANRDALKIEGLASPTTSAALQPRLRSESQRFERRFFDVGLPK